MLDFLFGKKQSKPAELFYHTDIHCHIMPGVDHGAGNEEESLALLEAEMRWGITRLVLTSHVTEVTFENNPTTLAEGFRRITDAVKSASLPVELAYSAEYRIDELFMEQFEKGDIVPMPQKYLLVENSYLQEPWGLDNLLFDIKVKGYRPIMAHPERFLYYHDRVERYDELHRAGNLFQINLLSLAGYHGKAEKKMAEKLVEKGYADFLGSDIHHMEHVESIEAYLKSKDYQRMLPMLRTTVKNDSIVF
ncbi:MAG: hypothetical protein NC311_16200 [Muribaculaceae bacterium]|nr:hypothetical protein [Muribaculaceae bacterium]